LSDTFSRQGLTPNKLKSTVVLHIGQPVKIVVAEPDRVIVAEQAYTCFSLLYAIYSSIL
jgi:hypothetical protein